MPDRDSFPHRVKLDLCSSIKSWSSAAVRNDFAVFMFSSFLWSSQIVSHVQIKLKVGAFVAWTRIALCFEEKVCKPRSPPHPPLWKVRFPVWYARNRSDTWRSWKHKWAHKTQWLVKTKNTEPFSSKGAAPCFSRSVNLVILQSDPGF